MSPRKVSNKQIRDIQRATHLVAALVLVLYVYIPLGNVPHLTTVVQFAVLPLLALTGMLMWQWTRLRKWLTFFWGADLCRGENVSRDRRNRGDLQLNVTREVMADLSSMILRKGDTSCLLLF